MAGKIGRSGAPRKKRLPKAAAPPADLATTPLPDPLVGKPAQRAAAKIAQRQELAIVDPLLPAVETALRPSALLADSPHEQECWRLLKAAMAAAEAGDPVALNQARLAWHAHWYMTPTTVVDPESGAEAERGVPPLDPDAPILREQAHIEMDPLAIGRVFARMLSGTAVRPTLAMKVELGSPAAYKALVDRAHAGNSRVPQVTAWVLAQLHRIEGGKLMDVVERSTGHNTENHTLDFEKAKHAHRILDPEGAPGAHQVTQSGGGSQSPGQAIAEFLHAMHRLSTEERELITKEALGHVQVPVVIEGEVDTEGAAT